MQLYWAPKSRSLKAIWMLEESGLSYDRNRVSFDSGELQGPIYRAINPMMKVPAIIDGPVKVAESGAILAYIAEQAPDAKLAPGLDHPRRGDYLRWLFFSAGCIEAAFAQKFTGMQMPARSAGWGDYDRVITVLDEALAQGPWLLGDRFSAADVAVGSDLRFGVDVFKIVEAKPNFRAYIDRCTARPAFRRAAEIEAAG
jgi:glutathione S-transferase